MNERQVFELNEKKGGSAFSSYSGVNMQIKNITSDMWAPITTSKNYTAYTPDKNEAALSAEASLKKKQTQQLRQKPKDDLPKKQGSGRDKPSKKKKQAAGGDRQSHQPISTMTRQKPPTKQKKKNGRKQKIKPNKIHTANFAFKQCEKNNKAFVKLIKSGKSPDEARRILYLRKLRKKKLKNLSSVMFLFFFACVFVLSYSYYRGASVENILVDGDDVYSRDEILEAAKLSEGVNMLTVREKSVNESVTKALPFISAIKVDYNLPDTLKLNVISTTERLIIKNANKYICVDKTGKVVSEKKKKLTEGTFLVQGMQEQDCTVGEMFTPTDKNKEKFNIVLELASAAENNKIITYGVINVEDLEDITLTYKSKLRIYLGDGRNLTSKLSQAEQVIEDNEAQDKIGYVNVKYNIGAYFMQGSMDNN